MATRLDKRITVSPVPDEPVRESATQLASPAPGRFWLQVDRQTKSAHPTFEAAEEAGTAIKKKHPVVQVAVYDLAESVTKVVELPKV